MKKETNFSNGTTTIFDDVFRTMVEKMPNLIIPVVNEVFHTEYEENEKVLSFRNEHHTKRGKNITDSCVGICNKIYHIECQSWPDHTIVVRMFEYDTSIAIESAMVENHVWEVEFPSSCVLYLRHTGKTPEKAKLRVKMPNGHTVLYKVPIIKVQDSKK